MSESISPLLTRIIQASVGSSPMGTRSRLLRNVLRAWDHSVEGALYLNWLAEADPRLDGGLVLREAVLEWTQPEKPASIAAEKALAEFCARLSPASASTLREKTAEIPAARSQIAQAIRESTLALRKLRDELGCGRLEALNQLAAELQRGAADHSQALWRRFAAAPELSARIAALRRTTAGPVDVAAEWRRMDPTATPPVNQYASTATTPSKSSTAWNKQWSALPPWLLCN